MIDAEFCEYFGESACSGRYMGELVFSGGIEFESSETFEVFDVFWGRVDGHLSEPQVEGLIGFEFSVYDVKWDISEERRKIRIG